MKIGIIGGGAAGLLTTWLLEQEHEVILFEQNNSVGGHAKTVYIEVEGKKVPIEIGFEFFNEKMFPNLCNLLKILNIKTKAFPLSCSFFKPENNKCLVLPPIQKNKISFNSLSPSNLLNLIQLQYLINNSYKIVNDIDKNLTLEDFLNKLYLTNSFKNQFFLPLFCAGWGANVNDFKKFSAYNVLSWIIKNKPIGLKNSCWLEIVDGVSSYINKLHEQITKAKIINNAQITKISYENNLYSIQLSDGSKFSVDQLVIATNAQQASTLLSSIEHSKKIIQNLDKIEYIDAKVAIHSDLKYMPKNKSDWSIGNVIYNGNDSALTFYKKWKSNTPLFRSWIFSSLPQPETIYALENFKHAKPDLNYFETQKFIESVQGKNNLWFAGLYTHDIDAHESAIVSAIKIAKQLAPESDRLINLNIKTLV